CPVCLDFRLMNKKENGILGFSDSPPATCLLDPLPARHRWKQAYSADLKHLVAERHTEKKERIHCTPRHKSSLYRALTMSPEQPQYIWCKTIPHIEVGMGSGVFTSHRSARFVLISD
nr:hypothetical protein [Tanacetum cinerariifolium]